MTLLHRSLRLLGAAFVAAGLAAPAAHAAITTTTSTNWSGYAVHRSGVDFRTATASWRQPSATCLSQTATYSSFWVGIGGYRKTSDALEQIGTELDCSTTGAQTSSAWYELVPSAAHTIHMTVDPGDLMSATVTVDGTHVTVTLKDRTRGTEFTRTIHDRTLDVTSAEWIVEAPSECSGSNCSVLPLADFGTARFLSAGATTTTGVTRSLTRAPWTRTRISLGSSFEQATDGADVQTRVTATPSALTDPLGAFGVSYASSSTTVTTTEPSPPPSTGPGGPGGPPS
ncbi:MAG TPA: G1 family glutamic endopeptidase [Solirubrobacteraceae bacterium]|nr:G1 family glutamic endopeptidase [Solirubrobacteraceae bacterium]